MISLLSTVASAQFQLAYDGPSLRAGAMDVNELAPALLAVSDLVQEANLLLNGTRATASVRVRSDFKKGSFEIALLIDQSLLEHAKNLLPGAMATVGAGTIVRLLFGSEARKKGAVDVLGSVLDVWKKFK